MLNISIEEVSEEKKNARKSTGNQFSAKEITEIMEAVDSIFTKSDRKSYRFSLTRSTAMLFLPRDYKYLEPTALQIVSKVRDLLESRNAIYGVGRNSTKYDSRYIRVYTDSENFTDTNWTKVWIESTVRTAPKTK